MKTKRFATEDEATEFAAAVDKAAGCPIYGVDVGGGRHVDPEVSKTVRISEYIFASKEPEGQKYLYFVTPEVEAHEGKTETVDGKEVAISTADAVDDYQIESAKDVAP